MFVSQKGFTRKIEAIGFRMAEFFDRISKEEYFDMAYTIEEAEYRGNKYLQLVVKDIRFAH
jgi:single-stranded-DNA-specific exonuclease